MRRPVDLVIEPAVRIDLWPYSSSQMGHDLLRITSLRPEITSTIRLS